MADLRGGVWAYNDVCSLSGFHCLLRRIDGRFFRAMRASGAHHTSIDWAKQTQPIDSNGLRIALARDPSLGDRVRVLESWGPHPIQPIVAPADLPLDLRRVDESLYAGERAALAAAPSVEAVLGY